MSTDNTENENRGIVRNGGRWLRVGLLTFSMAGPVINTFLNQMRKRSQALQEQAGTWPDTARNVQTATLQRLDAVTQTNRQRATEQAKQLRKQARQLQTQAEQLRKALRDEAKQRQQIQKLQKQWQKSGGKLSQELLKRGEVLTGDFVSQSSKLSQSLLERGSQVTQDLTGRGSKATQELVKRGSQATQDLLERGGKVSQELLERGGEVTQDLLKRGNETTQEWLERGGKVTQDVIERSGKLVRRRNSRFWTVVGFTTGLVAAGVVTYVLVRQRFARQLEEYDEQIELPQSGHLNGNSTNSVQSASRPTGEVRHINSDATAIATVGGTKTENATQLAEANSENSIEAPTDAVFVGVVSTRLYYPVGTQLEAKDLIYFASADEAQADGFTAAPTA